MVIKATMKILSSLLPEKSSEGDDWREGSFPTYWVVFMQIKPWLYRCAVMLWLLCAMSYFAISADGVKSTCNAGSVRMGEETRITCRFEEDISKTQHDVRLFYNTTPVLVIAWSDGSPEIHTKHGYQFDGKINDTLTLEIPDAKLDQAGLYACHIVLSDADDASPCTLNVTGDWYITTAKDPCPAICSTSSTFHDTGISNDNTASVYKIVIYILAGTLVGCGYALIAMCIYIKRIRSSADEGLIPAHELKLLRNANKYIKKKSDLEDSSTFPVSDLEDSSTSPVYVFA